MTRLDDDIYERLVAACASRAWRAARRVAADDALASDAVQDAFLRVLQGRAPEWALRSEGPDNESETDRCDGLCALAVRSAMDRRRSDARRRSRESRSSSMSGRDEPDPHDLAIEKESGHVLRNAVDQLDEDLATPIQLRFDEGLSFAAIAHALRISESTAHDRVQRAMKRLRVLVGAAGMTVGVSEAAMRAEWSADGAGGHAIPAGLEARLLEQGSAAAVVATTPPFALVVTAMVVAASGLVFAALPFERDEPVERDLALEGMPAERSTIDVPALEGEPPSLGDTTSRVAVAPASLQDRGSQGDRGPDHDFVLTGRVTDGRGRPIGGASVRLFDGARSGKLAGYSIACEASEDGRYSMTVPMAPGPEHPFDGADPVTMQLEAGHLGFVLGPTVPIVASAGTSVERDLELDLTDGGRAGDYALDLLVRDARGEPIEGATVELTHVAPVDSARLFPGASILEGHFGSRWVHSKEARASTDARGIVRLTGERLGPKSVWIEAPGDIAPMRTSFAVLAEGLTARDVTLRDGDVLRGRFVWASGDELEPAEAGALSVAAVLERNRWRTVRVASDGSFEVRGLQPGQTELRIQQPWNWPNDVGDPPSPARVELDTGDRVHELRLKRFSDPSDVGLHDGELHGSAYNARTGDVVPLTEEAVIAWPIGDLPAGDLAGDLIPNLVHVPPFQRMMSEPRPAIDSFHRVGLSPGTYMMRVHAPGGTIGWLGPIVIESNEVHAGLRVALEPPAKVEVVAKDALGRPVEDAVVLFTGVGPYSESEIARIDELLESSNGREQIFSGGARVTNDEGRAVLTLPAGVGGVIAVLHARHEPAIGDVFETKGGDARAIELRLTKRR